MTALQIVIVTLLLVAVVLVVMWGILGGMIRRQVRAAHDQWRAEGLPVVRGPEIANYRGYLNTPVPVRGLGVLGLTRADLRFYRLAPQHAWVIPLAQILRVEVRRSWRGSYRVGMRVLVVTYRENGSDNAIGLGVRDAPGWQRAVAAAANLPLEDGDQAG